MVIALLSSLISFCYFRFWSVPDAKPYTAWANIISGNLKFEALITEGFVMQS
jgi:hypothetical protein